MGDDSENDRYRAGRVDAELKEVNRRLGDISEKLDKNFDWQRGVDARLATGNEKFEHIEDEIVILKRWDKIIGLGDALLAFIAAIIGLNKQ